jgi:hypothetical protein
MQKMCLERGPDTVYVILKVDNAMVLRDAGLHKLLRILCNISLGWGNTAMDL